MRSFYILFAFLAATVMAAPSNGQPSEKLTKRQEVSDYPSPNDILIWIWLMNSDGANITNSLMANTVKRIIMANIVESLMADIIDSLL
ncbi:hypothetical protein N7504_006781 [Penicillium tannophilum]|nr:hypothetical protein N7504_006781 [Penicillium tannophilum]